MNLNYFSLELFKTLKKLYPNKEYYLLNTEDKSIIEKDFKELKKEFLEEFKQEGLSIIKTAKNW